MISSLNPTHLVNSAPCKKMEWAQVQDFDQHFCFSLYTSEILCICGLQTCAHFAKKKFGKANIQKQMLFWKIVFHFS